MDNTIKKWLRMWWKMWCRIWWKINDVEYMREWYGEFDKVCDGEIYEECITECDGKCIG